MPTTSQALVVQELLQGFAGSRDRARLLERLSALTFIHPVRDDHVAAAEVRNACRRKGVQVGTIDALLATGNRVPAASNQSSHRHQPKVQPFDSIASSIVRTAARSRWPRLAGPIPPNPLRV
jgi:hypothetical protein